MTTMKQAGQAVAHFAIGVVIGALGTVAAFSAQLSRLDERTAATAAQVSEIRTKLDAVYPSGVAVVSHGH